MEMTRENQLRYIEDGCAKLGIKIYPFEIEAGLSVGTMKDFKKGKLPMRSDNWQKIERFFAKHGIKSNNYQSGSGEVIEAYTYTLKAILNILVQQQLVSPRGLDQVFAQARDHYKEQGKSNAAEAIEDLRAFAIGEPPGIEQATIRKLSELVPLGVA